MAASAGIAVRPTAVLATANGTRNRINRFSRFAPLVDAFPFPGRAVRSRISNVARAEASF